MTDVRQSIGDRALHQPLDWRVDGFGGIEPVIERVEHFMEASSLGFPRKRLRFGPLRIAVRQTQGPIKQVADVSQDFGRSADGFSDAEIGEFRASAPQSFGGPVAYGGYRVAEQSS